MQNPPKYDFGYTIDYESGNKQGHLEQRDGEHTEGHYYVDLPNVYIIFVIDIDNDLYFENNLMICIGVGSRSQVFR